jgi:hypothetical protein
VIDLDKTEITISNTNLKVNPPKGNILPFEDSSKRKIMKKEP